MGRSRMFLRWLVAAFVALVVVGQWGAGWGSAACDSECRESCAGACCASESGPAGDEASCGAVAEDDEGCCSKRSANVQRDQNGPVVKGACDCGHRRIELAALLERWIEPVSVEVRERDLAQDAVGPAWREQSSSSSRPEPAAPPPKA